MANVKRDQNSIPGLLATSNSDNNVVLPVYVDSATNRLLVDAIGTITGQQYTEGDTDSSITGPAILAEGTSNTLRPVKVDDDGHLQVDILSGAGAGTQYTEGDTDASITGTALLFEGAADTLIAAPGTAANGLDVDVTRVSGTVTVDGSGVTQPISHAALTELAAAIDTEVQVDVVGALPAGDNNIGNVDIVSSALPTGAATSAKQDTIIGHLDGVEGLLTTIDTDTGTLAGAVSGTEMQVDVVAALPAGDNNIGNIDIASLPGDVEADIDQIRDQIDLITPDIEEIRVDADAIRVATETLDNTVKAEDAGHSTGDSGNFVLGVRNDTPNTALTNTDADYGQFSTDKVGGIRTALYETDFAVLGTTHVKKYYTNAGAVTDGIVWSPAAGKRWYITDITIQVSATATVTLEDDKSGGDEVVWKGELTPNQGWDHAYNTPLFSGEDAADLIITTTAGNVYVTITGYEI